MLIERLMFLIQPVIPAFGDILPDQSHQSRPPADCVWLSESDLCSVSPCLLGAVKRLVRKTYKNFRSFEFRRIAGHDTEADRDVRCCRIAIVDNGQFLHRSADTFGKRPRTGGICFRCHYHELLPAKSGREVGGPINCGPYRLTDTS